MWPLECSTRVSIGRAVNFGSNSRDINDDIELNQSETRLSFYFASFCDRQVVVLCGVLSCKPDLKPRRDSKPLSSLRIDHMKTFQSLVPRGVRAYAVPSFSPGASAASPNSPFIVFDRQAKLAQRERAAGDKERSRLTDYVKDEVAGNMVDRLLVSHGETRGPMTSLGGEKKRTDTLLAIIAGIEAIS